VSAVPSGRGYPQDDGGSGGPSRVSGALRVLTVLVVLATVVILLVATVTVQPAAGRGISGADAGRLLWVSREQPRLSRQQAPAGRHNPPPVARDARTAGDPLSPEDVALLQPGDFILRRGDSLVSRLIVSVLGGEDGFSHSGILRRDGRGEWMVIHSVSRALADHDGVQEEPLRLFVRNSVPGSTAVVRLRASVEIREAVVKVAGDLLARGAPFDVGFQLDNGAVYCSELLWLALPEDIRYGTTVFHGPGKVIRFESFLDPHYFDLVVDRRGMATPE
jgi:hypothetical protein